MIKNDGGNDEIPISVIVVHKGKPVVLEKGTVETLSKSPRNNRGTQK